MLISAGLPTAKKAMSVSGMPMVARRTEVSWSTATGLPGPRISPGSMSRRTITPDAGALISERARRSRADSTRASKRLRFTSAPRKSCFGLASRSTSIFAWV